jgi:hypothetical protein
MELFAGNAPPWYRRQEGLAQFNLAHKQHKDAPHSAA